MSFLFGDLTPAPLTTNFLEELRDLVDFAAALADADQCIVTADARRDELRRRADEEKARMAALVQTMARAAEGADKGGSNIIATAVGIGVLLFGASGVFGQLKDALNTIWEVQPKPGRGILATIRDRFLSFTMVLGTGFLLLVSLVVSAAVAALGNYLEQFLPAGGFWAFALNLILSLGIFTLMFALLYKFLPDVKLEWRHVVTGAIVTAVLFTIGKQLIGLYLARSATASSYGAAASVMLLLLWVYYSSQILLFGAEFTRIYAASMGERPKPEEFAERDPKAAIKAT